MYETERRSKLRLFEAKALTSLGLALWLVAMKSKYSVSLCSANASWSFKCSKIETVLTWIGRVRITEASSIEVLDGY